MSFNSAGRAAPSNPTFVCRGVNTGYSSKPGFTGKLNYVTVYCAHLAYLASVQSHKCRHACPRAGEAAEGCILLAAPTRHLRVHWQEGWRSRPITPDHARSRQNLMA